MAEFIPEPSCADPVERVGLNIIEAKQRILAATSVLSGWQQCAIREALNQILHQPIRSPLSVPPHANSAMDGYALNSRELQSDSFTLSQVGIAYAGKPYTGKVNTGECVRIMTGAVIPEGCDTVIMQENTETQANQITFHGQHKAGQNVRLAGEDIQRDDVIFQQGRRLTPADIGLLASVGIAEVPVKRPLRVAFFSTGDELRSLGDSLRIGQIYDSNRYTLFSMLKRLNIDVVDMGVVADVPTALKQALLTAANEADVIISSGGVSVGDADYVKAMLAELGEVNFWKMAMKPGRPLAFGKIRDKLFFGLPGNPVSVMVTFYQFVQPALEKMAGLVSSPLPTLQVTCTTEIRKRPGRYEFQRGYLFTDNDGETKVQTTGQQGSGILRSMSEANCFILLDEQCDGVPAGSRVNVQLFAGLV